MTARPDESKLVTVGILAYNEAATIPNVIDDLSRQTLFDRDDYDVRVHVVANGCTDGTVDVAKSSLAADAVAARIVASHVHDLEQSGKPNAWNWLIHQVLDPATELVIMLDADIRLPDEASCAAVVDRLLATPDALLAVDVAVSDLAWRDDLNFLERLVRAGTSTEHDPATSVTGQFYCARAELLRSIHLPSAIVGEDGFLRAMVLTNAFTSDENFDRIVLVPESHHVFESERTPAGLLRHQVRQTIGTIMNISLFGLLESMPASEHARDIERRNALDVGWLVNLADERWPRHVPAGTRRRFLTRRFPDGHVAVRQLPMRLCATIFDAMTYCVAIRKIRNGSAVGFW